MSWYGFFKVPFRAVVHGYGARAVGEENIPSLGAGHPGRQPHRCRRHLRDARADHAEGHLPGKAEMFTGRGGP
jgi:hypothetical protein